MKKDIWRSSATSAASCRRAARHVGIAAAAMPSRTISATATRLRDAFPRRRRRPRSPTTSCSRCCSSARSRAPTPSRVAKALLARFGSLAEVLGAPAALLQEVEGVGAAVGARPEAGRRGRPSAMARGEIRGPRVLPSWSAVLDYCRAAMAFEEREQFRILFLDKKNALIADEVQQTGTVDHTPVYPREVVAPRARAVGDRDHPGPQSSLGRPDPVARRHRDDQARSSRRRKPLGIARPRPSSSVGKNGHASMRGLKLI